MNNNTYLYVASHCESFYNKKNLFTGRVDSRLSPQGHKDAKKLALQLKDKKIDISFTSPLSRAKQTLRHILCHHPKTKVIVDKRLIERDYGDLSRKNKDKFAKEHPDLFPIYHRSYDIPPPGGESMKEVEKRVNTFIDYIVKLGQEEKLNILVIAHGNSIRPFIKYFERLSSQEMMELENLKNKIFTYKI